MRHVWLLMLCVACIPAKVVEKAKDRDHDDHAAWQLGGDDCDDDDATVHPGAQEICGDDVDNDCDGSIDDQGLAEITWYHDADGDGFGDAEDSQLACASPGEAWVRVAGDCRDADALVHPDADELCDGLVNDCDAIGLAADETDNDGDGWVECTPDPERGWLGTVTVTGWGECNDGEPTVYPGADEACDGLKNDCDAAALPDDEVDDDGDRRVECTFVATGWLGTGAVIGDQDCDDTDPDVYPGAPEICDGAIDNCNVDVLPSNEADVDGDGWVVCEPVDKDEWKGPEIDGGGDCYDNETPFDGVPGEDINPRAEEIWYDGIDENCDGADDFDQDGDGFRSADHDGNDCEDTAAAAHPGLVEVCNDGLDNDCDGTDNGCGWPTWISTVAPGVAVFDELPGVYQLTSSGITRIDIADADLDGTPDLVVLASLDFRVYAGPVSFGATPSFSPTTWEVYDFSGDTDITGDSQPDSLVVDDWQCFLHAAVFPDPDSTVCSTRTYVQSIDARHAWNGPPAVLAAVIGATAPIGVDVHRIDSGDVAVQTVIDVSSASVYTDAFDAILCGDLTDDGLDDVVVALGDRIRVFSGTADATVGSTTPAAEIDAGFQSPPQAPVMACADLDDDGDEDLVYAVPGAEEIAVHFGPLPTLTSRSQAPVRIHGHRSIDILDFDLDGKLDLVVQDDLSDDYLAGGLRIFLGPLSAGATEDDADYRLLNVDGDLVVSVAAGDLNGDGWPDIAMANGSSVWIAEYTPAP